MYHKTRKRKLYMLPLEKVEWLYAMSRARPALPSLVFNLRCMPCPRLDSTADWKADLKSPGPEYETTCNNHIPRSSAVILLPTKFPSFWTVGCRFQYLSSYKLVVNREPLLPHVTDESVWAAEVCFGLSPLTEQNSRHFKLQAKDWE